jgi:ketosteroid isomerase-like protein
MESAESGRDIGEILGILHAYHAAMVAARTDQLGDLIDDDYSLVHITGYVQPKDEWFDVIRSGQFDYHRIDIEDRTLLVSVSGDTATVTGRGVFDATINGMHAPWRLRFAMNWSRQRGSWRIMSARYSSF